jgi:hypothetical protein
MNTNEMVIWVLILLFILSGWGLREAYLEIRDAVRTWWRARK